MTTEFDKLLGAIQSMNEDADVLHKSIQDKNDEDDERIRAAAEDGNPDADGDGDNDVLDDDEGEESMTKSFSFELENGDVIEALDGTALVKSLINRLDSTESTLHKALGAAADLIGKQGDMIKSLQNQVSRLGDAGRGRKTMVSVVDKPAVGDMKKSLSGSEPQGISPQEFMAKALNAQAAGRVTGLDVVRAESALNKGLPVPQDIVARVTQ